MQGLGSHSRTSQSASAFKQNLQVIHLSVKFKKHRDERVQTDPWFICAGHDMPGETRNRHSVCDVLKLPDSMCSFFQMHNLNPSPNDLSSLALTPL